MVADRADLGGLGAHDDVAAVAAFPHFHLALGEDLFGFDVVQQGRPEGWRRLAVLCQTAWCLLHPEP